MASRLAIANLTKLRHHRRAVGAPRASTDVIPACVRLNVPANRGGGLWSPMQPAAQLLVKAAPKSSELGNRSKKKLPSCSSGQRRACSCRAQSVISRVNDSTTFDFVNNSTVKNDGLGRPVIHRRQSAQPGGDSWQVSAARGEKHGLGSGSVIRRRQRVESAW